MTNNEILEEISIVRNHSEKTKEMYHQAVKQYCNLHQKTLEELITEADQEEEQGIRWKRRKLKKRLLQFRQYLIKNYKKATIKSYFTKILVIYKYYDIEIGNLPPLTDKNIDIPTPIRYDDLLTHEEIDIVLKNTNAKFNAIILFMTSSGSARVETMNLQVKDFIESTKPYHRSNDLLTA